MARKKGGELMDMDDLRKRMQEPKPKTVREIIAETNTCPFPDWMHGVQQPIPGFEREILKGDNDANYQNKAIRIVTDFVSKRVAPDIPFSVYVVWFCKTLQNWKALVSTTLPDGKYYEVTYDGDKRRAYLDPYVKFEQTIVIPD
jgi:hypothetical protein